MKHFKIFVTFATIGVSSMSWLQFQVIAQEQTIKIQTSMRSDHYVLNFLNSKWGPKTV